MLVHSEFSTGAGRVDRWDTAHQRCPAWCPRGRFGRRLGFAPATSLNRLVSGRRSRLGCAFGVVADQSEVYWQGQHEAG
jgi:hypothetical protein